MRSRDAGVTIIELLIAMTIMLLLVAGVSTVYLALHKAITIQSQVNEVQANARIGLELVANDLRNAASFAYADLHLVSIQANLDADSTLERVKYSVVASVLKREYVDTATTTSDIDINVLDVSFTYYDLNDLALTTPVATALLASIRRVEISLKVYSPKQVALIGGTALNRTFRTSVTSRNLWLTSY